MKSPWLKYGGVEAFEFLWRDKFLSARNGRIQSSNEAPKEAAPSLLTQ
jgi:hypothetical protein